MSAAVGSGVGVGFGVAVGGGVGVAVGSGVGVAAWTVRVTEVGVETGLGVADVQPANATRMIKDRAVASMGMI